MDNNVSAQVETLQVSIKVLRIGNRQVTRNILDQIPSERILCPDYGNCILGDVYFNRLRRDVNYIGWVRDVKAKEGFDSSFLIFSVDGQLRQNQIYLGKDNTSFIWADGDILNSTRGFYYLSKSLSDSERVVACEDASIYSILLAPDKHLYIQA
jgi:hypothetical protein